MKGRLVARLLGLLSVLGVALMGLHLRDVPGAWATAHGLVLILGVLVPSLYYLLGQAVVVFGGRSFPSLLPRVLVLGLLGGAFGLLGALFDPVVLWGLWGTIALAQSRDLYQVCPKPTAAHQGPKDGLEKGDVQSLQSIRLAAALLALAGVLLLGSLVLRGALPLYGSRLYLMGIHTLLLGFGVVGLYGITHLWIPRFAGVPALAAGAIAGERNLTVVGLAGLLAGFLFGQPVLLLLGGAIAFLGYFVYMGVIGANIMLNKSKIQRVTPEFSYVPWVFAGVLWIICGVLLGVFLNVVPDVLAPQLAGLRVTHIHLTLLGGVGLLVLGVLVAIPTILGGGPPPAFGASAKLGILAFHVALLLVIVGSLQANVLLLELAMGAYVVGLGLYAASIRPSPMAKA